MASTNTEVQAPATFDYNESDAKTSGRDVRAQLTPNTMFKFTVTGGGRAVHKDTKNLQLRLSFAPVDGADRAQPVETSKYIDIPINNPEVAGHVVAATVYGDDGSEMVTGKRAKKELFKRAKKLIQAIDPEAVPSFGFRPDDEGKWRGEDGEIATQEQMDEASERQNAAILAVLKKWYTDTTTVIGAVTYGLTGPLSGDRVYVKYFTSDPGEITVESENFTL